MGKIAFVFPGQGAQYRGMGQDFYEQCEKSRQVMDLASEVTGIDLRELCFTENEKLNQTEYTQIAMVAVEGAILAAVREAGIEAQLHAGLSLGEYGALLSSGVMQSRDVFTIVRKRGILMEEAYPTGGAMAAVLGTEASWIEKVCEETEGVVSIANYNCPGQVVITGEASAVQKASERLKETRTKRVLPLKVSGPFHSILLSRAGEELGNALEEVRLEEFSIPYVSNVTAELVRDTKEVKKLLAHQVASPVRWQQSVERMIQEGVDTFLEIGPGKTLTGFLKKINKEVRAFSIQTLEDLNKVKESL